MLDIVRLFKASEKSTSSSRIAATYREELEVAYDAYKEELVKARADEIVYYH